MVPSMGQTICCKLFVFYRNVISNLVIFVFNWNTRCHKTRLSVLDRNFLYHITACKLSLTSDPHYAQVTLNQLVMLIAWSITLNVSCRLRPYSLQRTRSPPGPRLPKRIRNTHPRNYCDLKGGQGYRSTFSLLSRGIILWIELPRPENPANTCARHTETLDSGFDLIRSH